MRFPRASGILLHPTSLPGSFGIGDLGPEAFRFADFLNESRQSLWQVLPLGPTGYGDSPYACYSAFAGNTLLISPERLVDEGLLTSQDLSEAPSFAAEQIDFQRVYEFKDHLLSKAFSRFRDAGNPELRNAFQQFSLQNAVWLDDYALFRALKDAHDQKTWNSWERSLVRRDPMALAQAREDLSDSVEAHKFHQFLFFRQWFELKRYCNQHGIKMIGDIPIFVAQDSADVWTNPDQFQLDEDCKPVVVAGVPPDYFSKTGQFWGNPIYNWKHMIDDGFRWWIDRVRTTLQTVDMVRIDHFRGFVACWEIPGGDKTAERGQWVEAPGRTLFTTIRKALGTLPVIAEDLGVITPDVEKLRDDFGFPGMRILQFGFSSDATNIDLPHNYYSNVVVYTGTHDNDTAVGWFNSVAGAGSTRDEEQIQHEREFCMRYLNTKGNEINWDFIRTVLASVANTAIVPLQDLLGLGTEARMNLPNSSTDNWSWRFKAGELSNDITIRLRTLTELYGRVQNKTER